MDDRGLQYLLRMLHSLSEVEKIKQIEIAAKIYYPRPVDAWFRLIFGRGRPNEQ